jgi:hypothetical protein
MVQVVISLSTWRTGFVPGSAHVGFLVDEVAMGQGFLRILWFSLIIPPWFFMLVYHLGA